MLQDLCINMWPVEALPTSFFGLIARLREAVLRVALRKWSMCMEGDQWAYPYVKMHFWRIEAEVVAARPPEGKVQTTEQFFAEVAEGARRTEAMCPNETLYFQILLQNVEVCGMYKNYPFVLMNAALDSVILFLFLFNIPPI